MSPFIIREIIHLIVQKPIHEVSCVSSPPQAWVDCRILRNHLNRGVTDSKGSHWSFSVFALWVASPMLVLWSRRSRGGWCWSCRLLLSRSASWLPVSRGRSSHSIWIVGRSTCGGTGLWCKGNSPGNIHSRYVRGGLLVRLLRLGGGVVLPQWRHASHGDRR